MLLGDTNTSSAETSSQYLPGGICESLWYLPKCIYEVTESMKIQMLLGDTNTSVAETSSQYFRSEI